MISVDAWTTIRHLHSCGTGIRQIARQLGISRNTVRKALASESPPQYKRGDQAHQLDPFADEIREMVVKKKLIGSRILRELRGLGYEGSSSAFYRYLKKTKDDSSREGKVSERYETGPGQQAQFDWSTYTVRLGGELTRIVVYCLMLSYSRRKFNWASRDQTQGSIFEALERGFWYFDGCPREILVDNARAMVASANPSSFKWNRRFLELCGHYRIKPVACQVYRPRTKGKVERPFFYLENHLIRGREFDSFEQFCSELDRFTREELDLVIHSTTRERPIDRFESEKGVLISLPQDRYIGTREAFRKASWDCLISFNGTRYSIPHPYAGKQVWVRTSQGQWLEVYNQKAQLIARHRLSRKQGLTVILDEHYEGLRRKAPRTRVLLEQAFLKCFPDHQWFLERLGAQYRMNSVSQLRPIVEMAQNYPKEAMRRALAFALEYNTYSHRFILGVLERELPLELPVHPGPQPLHFFPEIDLSTDLSVYQSIAERSNEQ